MKRPHAGDGAHTLVTSTMQRTYSQRSIPDAQATLPQRGPGSRWRLPTIARPDSGKRPCTGKRMTLFPPYGPIGWCGCAALPDPRTGTEADAGAIDLAVLALAIALAAAGLLAANVRSVRILEVLYATGDADLMPRIDHSAPHKPHGRTAEAFCLLRFAVPPLLTGPNRGPLQLPEGLSCD